jgi:hypothetical protein
MGRGNAPAIPALIDEPERRSTMPTAHPIRFDPSMETPEADEAETQRELNETFRAILETTSGDYGHAVRSVHAKAHGIIRATLTVSDGLSDAYAQGLFARPGEHPAILRISTNPGDILDDSVSAPRGLALKVLGVEGERLAGAAEGAATQDFVMANAPAFAAPDPKAFLKNLKQLAATTDKGEGLKKAFSAVLQTVEGALETVGGKSSLLTQLGGAPNTHPLGETYYSQTPFLYGPYVAKFSVAPVSPGLTELTGSRVNTHDRPNALREDVSETMIEQRAVWEFRVQLLTDPGKMPIENASVRWDEEASPYVTVATIVAEPQASWTPGQSEATEDKLSFAPWHGLAAHRPLGAINRARRPAYEISAGFRAEFNRCPIHEPRALEELNA